MFPPRRLVLGSILLSTAPALAVSAVTSSPKYTFAEDALESRWSWRGAAALPPGSEINLALGWKDAANGTFVSAKRTASQLKLTVSEVTQGKTSGVGAAQVATVNGTGQLGLQKVGKRMRLLWNEQVLFEWIAKMPGSKFGTATRGGASLEADAPQPTEAKVFRDDFMRAEGPDNLENPGEWDVAGVWKTSGSLGPKSDAALNPNPFVFRAQGAKNTARTGKWWWSDYSVSTSLRATQTDAKVPLMAGLEAFSDGKGGGLRGEIDFKSGIAVIKDGEKVLARSGAFDTQPNEWHRVRLEPGPGTARFFVDGVLRVSAPSKRAEGSVALRAGAGGTNFVDFDDVRVGSLQDDHEWGEGALPDRFVKDRLMRNWASEASSWKRDGKGIWWHTGDFFGSAQLKMTVPALKVGQRYELIFAADPKDEHSGLRYEIERPTEKNVVNVSLLGSATSVAVPQSAASLPVTVNFAPVSSSSASLSIYLNGGKVGGNAWSSVPFKERGTKLGIRPLQNGKPLPPPTLQRLTVASATYKGDDRTMIGINFTPITNDLAKQIGLPDALGAAVDHVDDASPAKKAGVREGDVIRSVEGNRITDVESMKSIVGGVTPGTVVKLEILRPKPDLDWAHVTTPRVLDYNFTAAPVDWQAARGTWDIAERWTCSPQWSFFAGQNDASPLLWSRFATKGDWTLEAYLASPMDLARGERSPTDLNITVGGNGVDLSSGYSFIFGGKTHTVNQIRRGDAVAWERPFVMPPGVGETHQDWFYVRLERRQTPQGARFRYSVNGRELANYLDSNPLPDAGHIGFWTINGGLSIARVRLWNAGMRASQNGRLFTAPAVIPQTFLVNGLGQWSPRGEGGNASAQLSLASLTPATSKPALQITNPRSGGDWTTYVTRKAFNAAQHPVLDWDYKLSDGVKVNLYALVDETWREIVFAGGASSDDESDVAQLGKASLSNAAGGWRHASFDLAKALRRKGLTGNVEALAFAAPDIDYLRAGLGGNHRGATYWVRDFRGGK